MTFQLDRESPNTPYKKPMEKFAMREKLSVVPGVSELVDSVLNEVVKATTKFPTWPTDPIHAIAVLHEEVGELAKDVLQMTYEPHKTSLENVRKEAIQTAAMSLRFLASLDVYEYTKCPQHSQAAQETEKR